MKKRKSTISKFVIVYDVTDDEYASFPCDESPGIVIHWKCKHCGLGITEGIKKIGLGRKGSLSCEGCGSQVEFWIVEY